MDYNLPNHKEIMDLEGLEQWVPGRLTGFSQIEQANQYLDFYKTVRRVSVYEL